MILPLPPLDGLAGRGLLLLYQAYEAAQGSDYRLHTKLLTTVSHRCLKTDSDQIASDLRMGYCCWIISLAAHS